MTKKPSYEELEQRVRELERQSLEPKQAEDALRESENKYRELADLLPQTVFEIDGKGNFTFANRYGFESSGYTQEDIEKGLSVLQLFIPEDRGKVTQNIRKILSGEESQGHEYTALRQDGSTFPVLIYSSPVVRDNKPVGLRGIAIDMTEQKRAQEEVGRQRALLEAINRVFRETLTCKNQKDVARTCLSLAEEITGSKFGFICEVNQASRFETIAISDPGWDACSIPKTDAVLMLDGLEIRGIRGRVIKEERSIIFNDPSSNSDWIDLPEGHPRITNFLGVPLKHAGQTFGMIGLGNKESDYNMADQKDIETLAISFVEALHRKLAEEALEESEARHRTLVETMNEGLGVIDENSFLTYVNDRACEMLGCSRDEIIGQSVTDFLDEANRGLLKEEVAKTRNCEQGSYEIEWIGKYGRKIPTIVSATPLYDADGEYKGTFAVVTEITQLKQTEQALREREEQLQIKTLNLEEANAALKVLLKRRDEDKAELEEKVLLNVKQLVEPYIEKLKRSGLSEKQMAYADILQSNLEDIISPFSRKLSSNYFNFTPAEIQVANLVKEGKTTKEMAELLNSSKRAIEFHRQSLRKKLGLQNKKANLRAKLLCLSG